MSATRFKQKAAAEKQSRDVTIGVDFGTSTTKVMCRERDQDDAFVLASPDYGHDVWPSTISIAKGRAYFGHEAVGGGFTLRWLKMRLARAGEFSLRPDCGITPEGLTWECLATTYLAYVLRESSRMAKEHYGECMLTFNMAAPVAEIAEDVAVRDRFERALFLASRLMEHAIQGWELSKAVEQYIQLAVAHPKVPSERDRNVFVVPETHAAVAGLFFSRALDDGHHVAVDIGAGTTDISVFVFRRAVQAVEGYPGQITYLGAGTQPIAGNAADSALATFVCNRFGATAPDIDEATELVRRAKETSDERGLAIGGGLHLTEDEVERAVRDVCEGVFKHYRKTWYLGYEKEKKPQNWRRLDVLLLGGGSQFKPFRVTLERKPFEIDMRIEQSWITFPEGLRMLSNGEVEWIEERDFLFTIADGLSFHYAKMARAWLPPEVDPFNLPEWSHYDRLMRNDDD